jgi:NAD(P)-dependent dehydrogenase (short-subunit alcohol dehydrogenase family)
MPTGPGNLRDAVVLITGASRGLGLAMARAFAAQGASLALIARSADGLESRRGELAQSGTRVRAWSGDVTDHTFMASVVAEVERELGPIDVLINNAGTIGPIGPTADIAHDEWWRCVEINLRGTAIGMQLALPRMCSRGRGRVINVVSGGAITAATYFSAYVAAKTAVVRLTECAASEVAPYGVRLFSLEPGTVATDMSGYSVESVDGRRWIPWFKRIFTEGLATTKERVAERALALARGDADALSGRYLPLASDLTELSANARRIEDERLYSLRLGRLPAAPVAPMLAELRAIGEAPSANVLQLKRILRCGVDRAEAAWMNAPSAREIANLANGRVTITFAACDEGTALAILHEGIDGVAARDALIREWIACLNEIERVVGAV